VDDAGNLGRARSFDLGEGSIDGAALLSGKKLDLRDGADATHRRLTWVAKDARIALPEGDDRPTVAGATLRVLNPTTGESATLALPAALWTQLPTGSFRYRDPRFTMGPVRSALLRARRLAKVSARGSEIHFTLDEPSQGSLGVVLRSGSRQYCTLFGGVVKADRPGRFLARSAPPPAGCPGG
jgi:hypothetical protein